MLETLFSPIEIKGKVFKNRLVVSPMVTDFCDNEGKATERYIAYHEAKAKGGWGLILTEDYAIDPRGRGFSCVAGLWNDDQIESHSKLTERVHKHGAIIIAQIFHAGRQTKSTTTGQIPVAPSPIACPFGTEVPEELTKAEIETIIEQFGDTALRAKKAGFDGVMIHGGHGYLICQFMSPHTNKRLDEYGGSFLNRLRFPIAIIKNIRAKCGDDFIIDMRLSGDECVEGGLTLEDTKANLPFLEEAGLDMVHISLGNYASHDWNAAPAYFKHAFVTDWAAEVKQVVNIPVATIGRINDPFLADSLLRQGKADLIAMGRESLADPAMPNKAKAGCFDQIRKCIACNDGCIGTLFTDHPIRCVLNPTLGREYEGPVQKTDAPKKVAIIGAGPSGLYAAITAREAGHTVTVYEKEHHAGGQFYLASMPPCKGEITDYLRWLVYQCNELGVEIQYNTTMTVERVKEVAPDVVIVATGAYPVIPPIPGSDKPSVCNAHDLLAGKLLPGAKCVVVGAGQVGIETAHYLALMKRDVVVLEGGSAICPQEPISARMQLLPMLENRGVKMFTNSKVTEITDTTVKARGVANNFSLEEQNMEFEADTVVIAIGRKPENSLADALKQEGFDVRVIGDAGGIGKCLDATTAGYNVGREI